VALTGLDAMARAMASGSAILVALKLMVNDIPAVTEPVRPPVAG
jgi:Flp pilus assembly protein TadB